MVYHNVRFCQTRQCSVRPETCNFVNKLSIKEMNFYWSPVPLIIHFYYQAVHYTLTFIIHFFLSEATSFSILSLALSVFTTLLPCNINSSLKISNNEEPGMYIYVPAKNLVVFLSSKMADKLTWPAWTMIMKYYIIALNSQGPLVFS